MNGEKFASKFQIIGRRRGICRLFNGKRTFTVNTVNSSWDYKKLEVTPVRFKTRIEKANVIPPEQSTVPKQIF